jgi:protein-tyrosine-phosphatase
MAEAMFKYMVDSISGKENKIEVQSAGIYSGMDGCHATLIAEEVMTERGLDISKHKSQSINSGLVDWAYLILVMTQKHKHTLLNNFVNAKSKTYLLTEYVGEKGDVSDPVGLGIKVYREYADYLDSLLTKLIEKIL